MENTRVAYYNDTIVSLDTDGNYVIEDTELVTVHDDLGDVYFDMYEIAPIEDWVFTNPEFREDIAEWLIVNGE